MEYGDEKWHLNQFLGQDWIESMAISGTDWIGGTYHI